MAELDRKYEPFMRKWKSRIRVSDRHLADSFMRGEAIDAAGYGELLEEPGKTMVSVRVDGRGLDASADPPVIDDLIAEWEEEIADIEPFQRRKFTKDLIVQCVAANRHLEERGSLILSAAVWLAADNPTLLAALKQGDVALFCDFTFDDDRREIRMQISLGFPEGLGPPQ